MSCAVAWSFVHRRFSFQRVFLRVHLCLFATMFIASLCLGNLGSFHLVAVDVNFVNLSGLEVRGSHGMVTLDHLLLPELTGKLSLKALCF